MREVMAFASSVIDTIPPTPPGSLTASAASASQINLNWIESTDDVGVTGYPVYPGSSQIGHTAKDGLFSTLSSWITTAGKHMP